MWVVGVEDMWEEFGPAVKWFLAQPQKPKEPLKRSDMDIRPTAASENHGKLGS